MGALFNMDADKVKAAKEYEEAKAILDRLHNLRAALCRVNCKPLMHRPACKTMKKDIERLKEMAL
jgi:hypothetical protein